MEKYVIGMDNGGTVTKAALFTLQGREVAVASRQTPLITPQPGYTERDMEVLWDSNCECLQEVLQKSCVSPSDVIGIAVCGHGKGLYAWGKNGRPAYNGIVSTDNRAWRYPEKWKKEGTFEKLYPQLYQQLLACQQAALLAWMKDNRRDVYDEIQWVFSVKDYVRFRLTGQPFNEVTDLSSSGLMDVKNACVDASLLKALGIEEVADKIAPLKYSYELCGTVTKEVAQRTGLAAGTPVAGGMFDIDSCAVAMDITSPKQICTITGTWSINEYISLQPITGTSMNSLYAIPGYYLIEECSATSVGNLEWFLANCMAGVRPPKGKRLYDWADELVGEIAPEDSDVYYLPFLNGSNAHMLAKASFVGLTSYHNTAHMLRAVYEGATYSHKTHILRLLSARTPPNAIRMAGGAVNSPLWVQMFADVLGYPIETVSGVRELGALGCAMAAALAAGVYSDYKEAAGAMIRVNLPVLPDQRRAQIYEEKFKKYTAVVKALDTVWGQFTV